MSKYGWLMTAVCVPLFGGLLTLIIVATVHNHNASRQCKAAGHTWLDVPVNQCINIPPIKETK